MSSNPYMDYQDQFFKMWNDSMEKMMESDAYKAMAKSIPGSDAYAKAMESMVPSVEKYWKTMASSMPGMDFFSTDKKEADPMDTWKDMMSNVPGMDAWMDAWKEYLDKIPGMDAWKEYLDKMPAMEIWKTMMDKMPGMDFWKNAMPGMDFWKNAMSGADFWKKTMDMMPDFNGYWKTYTDMIPGLTTYWDNFAKMMPDPSKFMNMAPFKVPGLDSFTKVFDLWKSFGDPDSFAADFQKKYMDAVGDMIKSLFPENMQAFVMKPMDFMDAMVNYYKQYVSPWMEIDDDIMKRLSEGDVHAYVDFFKDYEEKYEESLEKYFTMLGMGLNREANEDYMKTVNSWNKAMISMGELMAVITETADESFKQIGERVLEILDEGQSLTTFKDFYKVWYTVSEEAFEKLLFTEEFAKVFDDYGSKYSQYMIAQNKVYERMLSYLPIPTNTDMKSLYKTVYDLRKEVRDLKKAMAEKEDKKGDK